MTEIRIHVDIPALDRLCAVLERKTPTEGTPAAAPVAPEAPATRVAPAEAPEPAAPAAVPPAVKAVGLPELQRAGASLRDLGKLDALKALLTEFGASSLVALPPEHIDEFAARLRELGAKL